MAGSSLRTARGRQARSALPRYRSATDRAGNAGRRDARSEARASARGTPDRSWPCAAPAPSTCGIEFALMSESLAVVAESIHRNLQALPLYLTGRQAEAQPRRV